MASPLPLDMVFVFFFFFFGGFQHPPVDGCSTAVILVFSEEKMSACLSTPFCWERLRTGREGGNIE